MSEANDNNGGDDRTIEAEQASAGEAQRIPEHEALAEAPEAAMSPEDLDARQEDIGMKRRSGPPLADEEDTLELALAAPSEEVEPTEVDEPQDSDG
jgi:hypothetical protein